MVGKTAIFSLPVSDCCSSSIIRVILLRSYSICLACETTSAPIDVGSIGCRLLSKSLAPSYSSNLRIMVLSVGCDTLQ